MFSPAIRTDLESLFKAEFVRLGNLILPLVGDAKAVEIMTSEAFAQLWDKRDLVQQRPEMVDFLENALLAQAVRHLVDNRKAGEKADPPAGDLAAQINALPTHARAVWTLAHRPQLSFDDIGEMLDLSGPTVAKQLGKAIRLLYKGMKGIAQPQDRDRKAWASYGEALGRQLAGEAELPGEPKVPDSALTREITQWWTQSQGAHPEFQSDPEAQWKLFLQVVPEAQGGQIVDQTALMQRKANRLKWRFRLIVGGVVALVGFLLYLLLAWIF